MPRSICADAAQALVACGDPEALCQQWPPATGCRLVPRKRYCAMRRAWREVLSRTATLVDRSALRAMTAVVEPTPWDEAWAEIATAGASQYQQLPAHTLFAAPADGPRERSHVGPGPHGTQIFDLAGESAYSPLARDFASTHARHPANLKWHARLWTRGRPGAHVVVCLHGWRAGPYWLTEAMLPVQRLLAEGYDVVAPVLPLHGPRATGASGEGVLGPNLVRTAEILGQAVSDVRAVADEVRRMGAGPTSVLGISLGGLVAALWASVDPALSAVIAIAPATSLGALLWTHATASERGRAAKAGLTKAWAEALLWPYSPLAHALAIGPQRTQVLVGNADAITLATEAQRLADHWCTPLVKFAGGHIAHWQRGAAVLAILDHLAHVEARPWKLS